MTRTTDTSDRAFVPAWYVSGLLRELVLIYPVYAIMMGEHGISPFELSMLFAIWSVASVVLEVPSGTLADRYSRRHVLVVSGFIKSLTFLFWWWAPGFWGYAAGFVCWSLAGSLMSGTAESLLHDKLAERGDTKSFERIYGRWAALKNLGVTIALAAGGWIAELQMASGYAIVLFASTLAPCLSALVIWRWVDEPPRTGVADGSSGSDRATPSDNLPYLGLLRSGLGELSRSKTLMLIAAAFAATVAVYGSLEEYIGPFLHAGNRFGLTEIGLLYASAIGLQIIAVANAHRLGHQPVHRICTAAMLAAFVLAAATTIEGYAVAALLAVYFGVCAGCEILLQGHVQRTIEGPARATITSALGMITEVCSVGVYALIGLIATGQGWQAAIFIAAVGSGVAMVGVTSAALVAKRSESRARIG